jgi:hypothetical protein
LTRVLALVLVIGCGSPEPSAGGFGATCSTSSDCGCHDASGNDPLCERSADRLSCLGDAEFDERICTRSCAGDADCEVFGADSFCDPFDSFCRN